MRRIASAALALSLTACAGGGGGGSEGIVDFAAQLQPTAGYQVRGSANAVASLGRTALTLEIQNGTPGAIYPWHVHQGRCGSNGAVVGRGSDYEPLAVGTDGTKRGVATLGVQLGDDTEYFVNVHLSAQQMGVIVSCGQLVD